MSFLFFGEFKYTQTCSRLDLVCNVFIQISAFTRRDILVETQSITIFPAISKINHKVKQCRIVHGNRTTYGMIFKKEMKD